MIVSRIALIVNYCVSLYYLQGGIDVAKKFVAENGNIKEHDEFYKMIDNLREIIWV